MSRSPRSRVSGFSPKVGMDVPSALILKLEGAAFPFSELSGNMDMSAPVSIKNANLLL